MIKNDYVLRAMAKIAFPDIPTGKIKLVESEATWIRVQHQDFVEGHWVIKENVHHLTLYRYISKKRKVFVYLAYSEYGSMVYGLPVVFYHNLRITYND